MKVIISVFVAAAAVSYTSAFSITSPLTSTALQLERSITATIGQKSCQTASTATTTTSLRMSAEEMEMIALDAEERMDKTMSNLAENLSTIRTGRANPNMLDRVEADYYGAMTPISQMATISVPSSQQLQIAAFDKSSLVDIEKAIIYASLGFTPTNDINIPPLTEERRTELLKQCKSVGEEAKVAIRNIRRDCVDSVKKMEKAGDLGKDQALDGIDMIQKSTDDHVKSVDDSVEKKEKDVTTM